MKPELNKGMKAFSYKKGGKFFDLNSGDFFTLFFSTHSVAFKDAADMILDAHAAKQSGPANDWLVFPTVYLYRHCLELKLKELIRLGVNVGEINRQDVEEVMKEHERCPLWAKVKPFLLSSYPDDKRISPCEAVINEFHTVDKNGQNLRYDRTLEGKKLTPYKSLECISVDVLRKTMDAVFTFLSFAHDGIEGYYDACQEN